MGLDRIIVKQVKKHIASKGTLKMMWWGCMKYLQQVAIMKKCPSILQPNINIAHGIDETVGDLVAKEIYMLLAKLEEKPGYILKYIGYPVDKDDEEKEKNERNQ